MGRNSFHAEKTGLCSKFRQIELEIIAYCEQPNLGVSNVYQYAIDYDPDTQVPKIDYDPAKVRGYTGMSVYFDISWPLPTGAARELAASAAASEDKIAQLSQQLEDHAATVSRLETLILAMIGMMTVGMLMIFVGPMMKKSKNVDERYTTSSEVV